MNGAFQVVRAFGFFVMATLAWVIACVAGQPTGLSAGFLFMTWLCVSGITVAMAECNFQLRKHGRSPVFGWHHIRCAVIGMSLPHVLGWGIELLDGNPLKWPRDAIPMFSIAAWSILTGYWNWAVNLAFEPPPSNVPSVEELVRISIPEPRTIQLPGPDRQEE